MTSSLSSSSSSYPPVVSEHCSNVPVLFELLKSEEEQCRVWFRDEMKQIPDPLIDSLFGRFIMSSSLPFAVPQSRWTVSELCELLEGEKVETRKVLRGEMDRLVNTLFDRLTNKLRTNSDLGRSGDGGDRAQLVDTLGRVESQQQPSSLIGQPSTSGVNLDSLQQHSNDKEMELNTTEMIEIKEEVEDGEETRIIDIEGLDEDNQSGDDESVENAPMDWVKQEIKEEFVDGQLLDIKEEEEEEEDGNETRVIDIAGLTQDNLSGDDRAQMVDLLNQVESPHPESLQPSTSLLNPDQQPSNAGVKSGKRKSQTESSKAVKRLKPGNGDENLQDIDEEEEEEEEEIGAQKIITLEVNCTVPGCKSILKSREMWRQHLSTRHDQIAYKQLKDNVRLNQQGQTEHACTDCQTVRKSQRLLKEHWKRYHQAGKFKCSDCEFVANLTYEVRNHHRKFHLEKKLECTFEGCNKSFRTKHDLEQHARDHNGERPFKCAWDNCEVTFKTRSHAIRHVRMQHFHLPSTVKQQREQNIIDTRDPQMFVRDITN